MFALFPTNAFPPILLLSEGRSGKIWEPSDRTILFLRPEITEIITTVYAPCQIMLIVQASS